MRGGALDCRKLLPPTCMERIPGDTDGAKPIGAPHVPHADNCGIVMYTHTACTAHSTHSRYSRQGVPGIHCRGTALYHGNTHESSTQDTAHYSHSMRRKQSMHAMDRRSTDPHHGIIDGGKGHTQHTSRTAHSTHSTQHTTQQERGARSR